MIFAFHWDFFSVGSLFLSSSLSLSFFFSMHVKQIVKFPKQFFILFRCCSLLRFVLCVSLCFGSVRFTSAWFWFGFGFPYIRCSTLRLKRSSITFLIYLCSMYPYAFKTTTSAITTSFSHSFFPSLLLFTFLRSKKK